MKILSLDTEGTGLDLYHGAAPFLVTFCDEQGKNTWYEWYVDPLTRKPIIPKKDLVSIQRRINTADLLILQNAKFDYVNLQVAFEGDLEWDWSKVRDTLLAGHLLASNQPHDLTTMTLVYVGVNIQPLEDEMEEVVKEALKLAKREFPNWRVAKKGDPTMPSAKEKTWKFDTWLPRLIAKTKGYSKKHRWWKVTADYANSDTASTIALYQCQMRLIKERKLDRIYAERLKILPVVCAVEGYGVTLSAERLDEQLVAYHNESETAGRLCRNIAKSYKYDLELPKTSTNNSLRKFVFEVMKLPQFKGKRNKNRKSEAGPSLDKAVMEQYESTLPTRGKPHKFITTLRGKRKRDTAISYMESYKRYWLPLPVLDTSGKRSWYCLHPSLNPTGTDTLRWSSSNPNEQNISKQEGFNLRYSFGPAPGREWWSCDAKNIELRLPAYEAGEEEMVALFERPDDPPYYGSNHLLVAHVLHNDLFESCKNDEGQVDGRVFKKRYAATWYQYVKNGNFAVQYGAIEQSGTADRAYHVPGAQHRIQERFKKSTELNHKLIAFAKTHGYVETIPDKTVDPERGYPLLCTRTNYGEILPTVPLNYHVQGSAMWWTTKAMVRCNHYLQYFNDGRKPEFQAAIVMQVHDELVFDFPKSKVDPRSVKDWKTDKFNYLRTNLPHMHKIRGLMEQGGTDFGIPTPVSCEYHPNNWSEGFGL